MRVLTKSAAGIYELDARGVEVLTSELKKIVAHKDFPLAIRDLVALAAFLEKDCKSPKAAAQILVAAEAFTKDLAKHGEQAEKLSTELRQQARKAKKTFFSPGGPGGSGLPSGGL
jgi:hypothetical protein